MRRCVFVVICSVVLASWSTSTATPAQGPSKPRQAPPPMAPQEPGAPLLPARDELEIPTGEQWLGTVRIPVNVLADGKPLPAGTYRVRLTGEHAESIAPGQLAELERWVEFVQGNQVRGRAMAPVVPSSAVAQVADSRPPTAGRFRVERLKGDDFLRLWYNLQGDQILIHLAIPPRAPS